MTTELLNKVLKTNAIWVEVKGNEVFYNADNNKHSCFKINTYELAHICKEWVYKQKVIISSSKANDAYLAILDYDGVTDSTSTFIADTEPEAIFIACEWILKECRFNKVFKTNAIKVSHDAELVKETYEKGKAQLVRGEGNE